MDQIIWVIEMYQVSFVYTAGLLKDWLQILIVTAVTHQFTIRKKMLLVS